MLRSGRRTTFTFSPTDHSLTRSPSITITKLTITGNPLPNESGRDNRNVHYCHYCIRVTTVDIYQVISCPTTFTLFPQHNRTTTECHYPKQVLHHRHGCAIRVRPDPRASSQYRARASQCLHRSASVHRPSAPQESYVRASPLQWANRTFKHGTAVHLPYVTPPVPDAFLADYL
jgi:hypothetical protein